MKEKFEKFLEKISNYLGFPMAIFVMLSVISIKLKNTKFSIVVDCIITACFVGYLTIVLTSIFKKIIKEKFMISMLIASSVLFVLSYILEFVKVDQISNTLFVAGVIFLEIYLLSIIINNCFYKSKNIGKIIIFSVAFIVLGFISIYLSCYNKTDNDLFNALITIFSALIGGAVTLVGVAWTINNSKEEKKQEEIEKCKPYFTFNIIRNEPKNIDGLKLCVPEDLELDYECETFGELENSNHSVVILKRIFHDNVWISLQCNNTLIHNSKLMLNFRFSNPNDIVLEVSDVLGNLYYYKLNVLHTALISGSGSGVHTIRNIEKIEYKDIKQAK